MSEGERIPGVNLEPDATGVGSTLNPSLDGADQITIGVMTAAEVV